MSGLKTCKLNISGSEAMDRVKQPRTKLTESSNIGTQNWWQLEAIHENQTIRFQTEKIIPGRETHSALCELDSSFHFSNWHISLHRNDIENTDDQTLQEFNVPKILQELKRDSRFDPRRIVTVSSHKTLMLSASLSSLVQSREVIIWLGKRKRQKRRRR